MQSCPVPQPVNLIYELPSILERIPLETLFPVVQPLEVELGSGDGSFMLRYAKSHEDHNFIAIERLAGRIRKIDRKGRREGLKNLRGIRIESTYFLEYLLPPQSVSALHIYFPDPWPKRKHRKNRLINERFPMLARQALEPQGSIYLRTDDRDYFAQMTEVFGNNNDFNLINTPAGLRGVLTDFEEEFHKQGIETLHAAYRRKN